MGLVHGERSVPDRMVGCWLRRYIRFADGSEDRSTRVIWLQTASGMADMRIAAARPVPAARGSLAACSDAELLALAEQDCSCGVTRLDERTLPHPTATWDSGGFGFSLQPISLFPEPGWFEWRDEGRCMMEWAPSGAYEEDWRLEPDSRGRALHLRRDDEHIFLAGSCVVYARNRRMRELAARQLRELVAAALPDRERVHALLDFEMSFARHLGAGRYRVELSSLPWHEGREIDLGWIDRLEDRDGRHWERVSEWRE